ncbi:hypothetical protein RchiOBHm_Chr3g0452531 [Rosa chinensis]|uniref:Uncharacterized protein n=1 Tax=Rosa chinensis TaxID=74649 RepID=A0A2P6R6B6_ROSCH|nr:hypothetical protein RchiOBHm_Chr3g0452531 [Rosa chinensis]
MGNQFQQTLASCLLVQKLMCSTPFDLAQSNLAKSGQISRNALCPCGSKK